MASKGQLWIAISETGELIGYLMFGGTMPTLKVFQIFVSRSARGHGIGKKLVDLLKDYAREWHYHSISAAVAAELPANSFWESMGFSTYKQEVRMLLFGLNMPIALATSPMRFAHKQLVPERLWLMSSDAMQFTVQRVGQNRLQILSEKGMINDFEQSVRDLSREPLQVGQVVTTDGMRLEIKQLDEDGHPVHLELTLDSQHMDDVVIIYWTPDGFERTALPGEGEALVLYESAAR